MSMITVRDLDPEIKAKLRERAARRGRSMEAEVRQILADAVADDDEKVSIADSVFRHFAGVEIELGLPDRAAAPQRDIQL